MDKKQRLLDTLVTLDNIFGVSGEEYRVGEQLSKELKGSICSMFSMMRKYE